ncbi:hypothetical protein BKA70DRAFT_1563596 [Coprinopsis sp. MPI-PUGE-AT-0042]|nr:hypothetical protein BKA70DRAFT_1563596 [Coprinopsis sp. MPI-PUGE-AT-0042]
MSTIDREITPRVNSAMLPNWSGKMVRVPCKLIKFNDTGSLTVQASDGGQLTVTVMGEHQSLSEPFLEIIGKVISPTSLQMLACIGLGSEVDLKLVDDTINLIHDERFFTRWFSY